MTTQTGEGMETEIKVTATGTVGPAPDANTQLADSSVEASGAVSDPEPEYEPVLDDDGQDTGYHRDTATGEVLTLADEFDDGETAGDSPGFAIDAETLSKLEAIAEELDNRGAEIIANALREGFDASTGRADPERLTPILASLLTGPTELAVGHGTVGIGVISMDTLLGVRRGVIIVPKVAPGQVGEPVPEIGADNYTPSARDVIIWVDGAEGGAILAAKITTICTMLTDEALANAG